MDPECFADIDVTMGSGKQTEKCPVILVHIVWFNSMCCYLTKKCPEKLSHEVSSYLCYKIMFSYPLFGIISETQSYKIDIKELSLRGKSLIAKRKRKNSINKHFP